MRALIAFLGLSLGLCAAVVAVQSCSREDTGEPFEPVESVAFTTPQGWPATVYNFSGNPLTKQGIALGRKLFHDGILSKDGQFPCASCHQQFAAFATYDHNFSHGFDNSFTTRNAPGLFNLAWSPTFHHDGGVVNLDQQPLAPITATNEMAETLQNVMNKLNASADYRKLFRAAFGDETINTQRMTQALSQFMLTMVSSNSKYDLVKRGQAEFNLPEGLGYDLFKSKGCVNCHSEPLFTDNSFRNTGLPLDPTINDFGRMSITRLRTDSLKFKVPSLRNVQLTFPYGHDGRFASLDDALIHYRVGVVNSPNTDPLVRNRIALSNFEIGQIKAFLYTLTDTGFVRNAALGQP